ncbi:MAG TPA: carboxymuconolactone decarboxylase family protein, partial [Burkholderiales bacterium]
PDLPRKSRSLVTIAIAAATSRPDELRVHLRGALANGCTREEIREVLLLVAMYCGIPASNEAHRIALEVFGEA